MLMTKKFYNYIWDLKERPETINEVIIPNRFKKLFNNIKKDDEIGNLLFYGQQGIGKTTIAYCLANEMNRDTLYLNMSNEGVIDTIRNTINEFIIYPSFEGKKKLVICDEMDGMSSAAIKAFKVESERFYASADFIMITNHKNNIDNKLLSRLKEINFIFTNKELTLMKTELTTVLSNIIKKNGFNYEETAVKLLIKKYFPDIRKTINEAQKICTMNGNLSVDGVAQATTNKLKQYIDIIKSGDWIQIRQYIADMNTTPSNFYLDFFNIIDKIVKKEFIAQVISLLHKYNFEGSQCAYEDIALATFSLHLVKLKCFK